MTVTKAFSKENEIQKSWFGCIYNQLIWCFSFAIVFTPGHCNISYRTVCSLPQPWSQPDSPWIQLTSMAKSRGPTWHEGPQCTRAQKGGHRHAGPSCTGPGRAVSAAPVQLCYPDRRDTELWEQLSLICFYLCISYSFGEEGTYHSAVLFYFSYSHASYCPIVPGSTDFWYKLKVTLWRRKYPYPLHTTCNPSQALKQISL